VLFLDEFSEFGQPTLEVLRQRLEDRIIVISRAVGSLTFRANFILIAAMHPCPCDYHGGYRKIPHPYHLRILTLVLQCKRYERSTLFSFRILQLNDATRGDSHETASHALDESCACDIGGGAIYLWCCGVVFPIALE